MNYDQLTNKKQALDSHRPLSRALVNNLADWFRVELTYTSNAIEGNTLSRRETALVVEKGLTVGGKTLVEHLEATNHAHALDWISALAADRTTASLSERDIRQIHALVLKGIDDENAGRYRKVSVRIAGSQVSLPPAIDVPSQMTDFIDFLNRPHQEHPVKIAALAHYQLVTIHPFVDGNGRTARLLMNMLLLMAGYPMAIIRKRDRLAYLAALEEAQLGGSKEAFYQLIMQAVDRSLDIYLEALEGAPQKKASIKEEMVLLKIGELAKRSGVSISTIRHWAKEGLLDVAQLTASGYQLFDSNMLQRIKKIQSLKKQRFTLKEIRAKLK